MTTTEIKKELLKVKPIAKFGYIRQGYVYYSATFMGTSGDNVLNVIFEIPVNDMGSADFLPEMPAQSLNRWILNTEE